MKFEIPTLQSSRSKLSENLRIPSSVTNSHKPMYKFDGAQQYRHPDHVIRKSNRTERYSDTGENYKF